MVNLIIKKYGFLGNKQKCKCKKARVFAKVPAERSEDEN